MANKTYLQYDRELSKYNLEVSPLPSSKENKYEVAKHKIIDHQRHLQNIRIIQKGVQNLQLVTDESGMITDTQLNSNSRL